MVSSKKQTRGDLQRTAGMITFLLLVPVTALPAKSPVVRLEGRPGNWKLVRDGEPYVIRGAGGDASWDLLAKLGGNSVRTWGHERLGEQLDQAQKLGLTINAGIWLGQVRQGFDWSDADSLIRQREVVREAVLAYKDHPALLMWSLGNEMEDPAGRNGAVWSEINNLAHLVKTLDDRHPTMTVIAELGGDKVRHVHQLCPDIDILGINSYAGAVSVGERYAQLGGTKPYVLTEFGPPGIWEMTKNRIDAYDEPTSTAKAESYRMAYRRGVLEQPGVSLGSYAFLWGQKQEVTATWFSLLLEDGSRLAAIDALSELWTGKPVANRCPTIEPLTLAAGGTNVPSLVKPGSTVKVILRTSDPESDPLEVRWDLVPDEEQYGTGGDPESAAGAVRDAVLKSNASEAEFRLPNDGGLYRIYATVRDGHGGAAVANLPLRVDAPVKTPVGKSIALPLVVYCEAEEEPTFIPSGWMGDTKAIRVDPMHKDRPHDGATNVRCEFSANRGWAGVAWQHPARDWGDRRGGFNLTGARRLVFYARGESGGEEVSFGFGLIGPEKRYFDTAKRTLGKVQLSREWQRYEIRLDDLKGAENLERIKTGFVWTVASPGRPVVFYLDDVRWE